MLSHNPLVYERSILPATLRCRHSPAARAADQSTTLSWPPVRPSLTLQVPCSLAHTSDTTTTSPLTANLRWFIRLCVIEKRGKCDHLVRENKKNRHSSGSLMYYFQMISRLVQRDVYLHDTALAGEVLWSILIPLARLNGLGFTFENVLLAKEIIR